MAVNGSVAGNKRTSAGHSVRAAVFVKDDEGQREPRPDDFMGIAEIAERLAVSPQRASQLARQHDFPDPVGRTKAGAFWLRSEIERYSSWRQPRVNKHLGIPKNR